MTSDLYGVWLRHRDSPTPVYVIQRGDTAADAVLSAQRSQAVAGRTAADYRLVLVTRLPIIPEPVHVLQSRGVSAA